MAIQINIAYREDAESAVTYREEYVVGIEKVIHNREKMALALRAHYAADIFQSQEKYREDFKNMLGWPLTEEKENSVPTVKKRKLSEESWGVIYRISIEIMEEFCITGLLFRAGTDKKPLIIAQHGALGTPELAANFYGNTCNYNDVIERILQYDVNVFAPQLLIWSKEAHRVDFDRAYLDARLKRVGSSITAVEAYGITRILDYFEAQNYVSNFGMVGLSYGGFYTLVSAAIDTRIKSAVSCAYFNDFCARSKFVWSDWIWFHSAEKFSDAEIATLIYPRKLCIAVGKEDPAFPVDGARVELERLKKMCSEVGTDWLEFIDFDGKHEFLKDDAVLEQFVKSLR